MFVRHDLYAAMPVQADAGPRRPEVNAYHRRSALLIIRLRHPEN